MGDYPLHSALILIRDKEQILTGGDVQGLRKRHLKCELLKLPTGSQILHRVTVPASSLREPSLCRNRVNGARKWRANGG